MSGNRLIAKPEVLAITGKGEREDMLRDDYDEEIRELRAENAKLHWQLEANARANQEYADRNAVLAAENAKLQAALEAARGYIRNGSNALLVINAALNEETK